MDDAYQGQTVSNVLVIGITHKDATRLLFEDIFVAQLKGAGIDVVSNVDYYNARSITIYCVAEIISNESYRLQTALLFYSLQ